MWPQAGKRNSLALDWAPEFQSGGVEAETCGSPAAVEFVADQGRPLEGELGPDLMSAAREELNPGLEKILLMLLAAIDVEETLFILNFTLTLLR